MSTASKPPVRTCSAVLLIHNAIWKASRDHWALSRHLTLGRFEGSRFESVYHRLVHERHLDDGDPLLHGAYALVAVRENERYALSRHHPDSVVEQVADLIALVSGRGLAWSREIISTDDFRAELRTHELHEEYGDEEFRETNPVVFTDDLLDRLTRAWASVEAMRRGRGSQRLSAALGFFSQSWRAHGLDHTYLHLAAVLEALFAPPGTVGTPDALTRAAVRCAGGTADERARLGRLLCLFFQARASLVEVPYQEAAIDTVVAVFQEVAWLLERIFTTPALVAVFTSETARVQWLAAEPAP